MTHMLALVIAPPLAVKLLIEVEALLVALAIYPLIFERKTRN